MDTGFLINSHIKDFIALFIDTGVLGDATGLISLNRELRRKHSLTVPAIRFIRTEIIHE
ncbi:MAG: hypothetical protein GXO70_05780 [Acidobacteria bacterium]|nr:hypothetical protein [Acidobacteriota bacterium]